MKRLCLLALCLVSIISCSAVKEIPVQYIDKVEYRDTTIFIKDTIKVEVPKEIIKEIVPQDTISILRTSVALSTAKIEKGMLHHKLEQKGVIKTQIDTVVKVQYIDKYIKEEIPVEVIKEVKHIPNWCWYSLIANIILGVWFAAKFYFRFIK